jgi:SmpA/OmlA family protein
MSEPIFRAFLEKPQRRKAPWVALVVGLTLTAGAIRLVTLRDGTNIVTPRGVRTVHQGMTRPEVNQLLGRPFALADSRNGMDCYRYGYPNLENPSFVVYSLCYDEARLHDISEQRFTSWTVNEDGSELTPAGQH